MKELRLKHQHAPKILAQIEAGRFDILDQTGSVIFPNRWHAVAKPGIRITMRMWTSRQYEIQSDLDHKTPYYRSNDVATFYSDLEDRI
jgi:hypothetical protein